MVWMNVELPLFSDEDFSYTTPLQGNAYTFRCYYNKRMRQWFFDLSTEDGVMVFSGVGMNAYFPVIADYVSPSLSGFFWLQPKGEGLNQSATNPEKLSEYYQLFYMWEE